MHKQTPHMNLLTLSIMPQVPLTSSKCAIPVHDCVKRSSSVMNMMCSLPQASLRELNVTHHHRRNEIDLTNPSFFVAAWQSVQMSLRFVVLRNGFTRNWDEPRTSAVSYRYKEWSYSVSCENQLDNSGPSSPHNVQWLGKSHSEGIKTWLRQDHDWTRESWKNWVYPNWVTGKVNLQHETRIIWCVNSLQVANQWLCLCSQG